MWHARTSLKVQNEELGKRATRDVTNTERSQGIKNVTISGLPGIGGKENNSLGFICKSFTFQFFFFFKLSITY